MLTRKSLAGLSGTILMVWLVATTTVRGQSFGIELHNTLTPASGGMAGTSIARPQDMLSAMGQNPAALTQYPGTHFTFGGSWVEPTYTVRHTGGVLPNLGAFDAKSEQEGSALGNIGVTQELSLMGRRATLGLGLLSTAGAGLSLRDVPQANGTSVSLAILQIGAACGVELTDQLSVGATIMLGSSTLDAPFQGLSAAALAYSLRASGGITYELTPDTTLGAFVHTPQNFNYDDAIRLQIDPINFTTVQDVNAGLPANYGLGIANESLLDGRLLLAADVLYKQWETADMFGELYKNQWVLQLGTQYCVSPRVKLRLGYAYAENPINTNLGQRVGGVLPPGPADRVEAGLRYVQATVAAVSRHRVAGGVQFCDIMPGVNLDLFAGGMFRETQNFDEFTTASIQGYWAGGGLTWHFGSCGANK